MQVLSCVGRLQKGGFPTVSLRGSLLYAHCWLWPCRIPLAGELFAENLYNLCAEVRLAVAEKMHTATYGLSDDYVPILLNHHTRLISGHFAVAFGVLACA